MSEKTDEQIAKEVQAGDREVFAFLIERYEQKLKRYARRFLSRPEDIDDAIQDVFIKSFVNINSFDSSRSFSSWVYRIAHNELVNILKKKKHISVPIFELDVLFPSFVKDTKTLESYEQKDLREMLETCLDELSVQYKEILVFYFFEEFEYKEIADILHIPISTVGVRINRAKKQLLKVYQKHNN